MQKTAVGLFDNRDDAERAVNALHDAGYDRNDISVAARGPDETRDLAEHTGTKAAEGAGTGAVTGTIVGGLAGVLVGAGLLAIPGIGPVLAVGPLAAAIGSAGAIAGAGAAGAGIGAASGGLLGALTGAGVPEDEANVYAEGVRRGGALVVVHTDDSRYSTASELLRAHGATDVKSRGEEYRVGGWNNFDPNAEPYRAEPYRASSGQGGMNTPDRASGTTYGGGLSGSSGMNVDSSVGRSHRPTSDRLDSDLEPVTGDDYGRSSKAGTVTGGAAGAATGAALGAAGGPVGAVVGGVAGAVVGGGLGAGADAVAKAEEDEASRTASVRDDVDDPASNSDDDERRRSKDTTNLSGRV